MLLIHWWMIFVCFFTFVVIVSEYISFKYLKRDIAPMRCSKIGFEIQCYFAVQYLYWLFIQLLESAQPHMYLFPLKIIDKFWSKHDVLLNWLSMEGLHYWNSQRYHIITTGFILELQLPIKVFILWTEVKGLNPTRAKQIACTYVYMMAICFPFPFLNAGRETEINLPYAYMLKTNFSVIPINKCSRPLVGYLIEHGGLTGCLHHVMHMLTSHAPIGNFCTFSRLCT